MEDLDEVSVSPIGYLKIFFRRKELILIPAFVGLVLGICTGTLVPKQYQSSTIILVQEAKSDNPLFAKLAVSTTVSQRMATIKESILGWGSLTELVKRLKLDKNVKTQLDFEKLIYKLRKDIIIQLRGNNLIHLAYVGLDPQTTKEIVENVTEIFIGKNVKIQNEETSDAIHFIEEQLYVYKGKIKSAEIAQMQEQLDELLIDSTEKHPNVKDLRERIIIKKQELEEENLEFTENIKLRPAETSPIVSEIQRALNKMESNSGIASASAGEGSEYYKLMLIDKLDTVMARDAGVNEAIYNTLLQRLETAKITQRLQSSKEGTRYTVLDPPRVPLKPFKPNKALMAFMGIFVGLIFGIALVIGVEFLDKSFIDVEEANNYLGSALLGAISKINTVDSLRREKEKERWVYSMVVLSGIFVIVATISLAKFLL